MVAIKFLLFKISIGQTTYGIPDLKSSDYTEIGVRIIQLQNIGDGKFVNDYKIYTSEEKARSLNSNLIYLFYSSHYL